jgi:GNAT superfamily N-acetyltransferase
MTVRLLRFADVPAALRLCATAGWNQTAEDWRRMIELEPEACFGVEVEGELVATTTLLCYGADLAWVGMVLTHPDHQRRGYGRQLVSAALDVARARQIPCIKLDATDQGRALYESLGFVVEQAIERWRGPGRSSVPAARAGVIPLELDKQAFGADRSRFLQALDSPPTTAENGYVMSRPGAHTRYLGPCIATDRRTAESLISATLAEGTWFWDFLPSNHSAQALTTQFGFERVRRLVRMRVGKPIVTRDDWVFAIAGFEAG